MKTKVFCIGFHKTGTSTMDSALTLLGYRVTGPNGVNDEDISKNYIAMGKALVQEFDAFQDNPWPLLYKEMDDLFPGSKFILTMREPESWIKSQVNHFGSISTPMRRFIYGKGSPLGNEQIYIDKYNSHNQEVIEYFRGREDDFLIMDLPSGDGWLKLCRFLGEDIPKVEFPRRNTKESRNNKKPEFLRVIKQRIKKFTR